ncbi:NUDIX domain-containing protein [Actinomadura fibrosa]|uniref:NUDIX domain-containing protein n=1 Tax=Actinomadura fibrosa TaxID=111802 RepID=A0ABW2XBG9_9ACTN|nr:NUDIX hydrolase [Actinomadura fibrosa]
MNDEGYVDNVEEHAVRQVGTRVVYENPWMTVREDEVERLDGSRGIYGVVDKPDFALVIPAENGGFHLVEEYRYPIGRRTWSFPQGTMPGTRRADPEELARRELAEEAGLRAGTLRHLGRLNSSHGTSSQAFDAFLATDLTAGEAAREHEEQDMRQRWVSRAEFKAMIRDGSITDDSSLAAYTLLVLAEEDS